MLGIDNCCPKSHSFLCMLSCGLILMPSCDQNPSKLWAAYCIPLDSCMVKTPNFQQRTCFRKLLLQYLFHFPILHFYGPQISTETTTRLVGTSVCTERVRIIAVPMFAFLPLSTRPSLISGAAPPPACHFPHSAAKHSTDFSRPAGSQRPRQRWL